MKRYEIINYLIQKYNYKDYLEIGTAGGQTFKKIKCENKTGVDPKGVVGIKTTSDNFFKTNKKRYDIIFIDGLHIDTQVDKDIRNSLKCLRKNGTIVIHDCNPPKKKYQDVPRKQKAWNGTVWKSIVKLRCRRKNIELFVVDTDWGCGILRRGEQKLYTKHSLKKCLQWSFFKEHKQELLNLKTIQEFKELI